MDYHLSVFGVMCLSGLPAVQSYVNSAINDSLWWMRKPEILMCPWVPGADLDTELSHPTRNIGQLELHILHARDLHVSKLGAGKPFPDLSIAGMFY